MKLPVVNYLNGDRLVVGSVVVRNNGNDLDFTIMDTEEAKRQREVSGEDQSKPVPGEVVI